MKKSTRCFLILLLFSCISPAEMFATDYFWKGGSGDFNDPNMWWLNSFGSGTTALQAPVSIDDVYFLPAAFTAPGAAITINSNANCHDMIWDNSIPIANMPTITSGNTGIYLDIYGSLSLSPNIDFDYRARIRFRSTDALATIDFQGLVFAYHSITFDGSDTTEWQLINDWTWGNGHVYQGDITIRNGHFNTMGYNMTFGDITIPANTNNTTGFTFTNSTLNVNGNWRVDANSTQFSHWDVSGSTINMINDVSWFYDVQFRGGNGMNYEVVYTKDPTSFMSNNFSIKTLYGEDDVNLYYRTQLSVDDLHLKGGNLLRFRNYQGNSVVNNTLVLEVDNIIVTYDCDDYVYFEADAFTFNTFRKKTPSSNLVIDQFILKGINADVSTGCTYTANNSVDAGNNINWTINEPTRKDMYFRDFIGDQNWHNPNNWEIRVGATFMPNSSGCAPSPSDNVFFDGASFPNLGQEVIVDSTAHCHDMTWEASITPDVSIRMNEDLWVFGDLRFNSNMDTIVDHGGIWELHGSDPDTVLSDGVVVENEIHVNRFAHYEIIGDLTCTYLNGNLGSTIDANAIDINTSYMALDSGTYNNVNTYLTGNLNGIYTFSGGTNMTYLGTTTFTFNPDAGPGGFRLFAFDVVMPNVIVNSEDLVYVGYNRSITVQGDYTLNGTSSSLYYGGQHINVTGTMALYNGDMYVDAGESFIFNTGSLNVAGTLHSIGDCVNLINWTATDLEVSLGAANIQYNFIKGWDNSANPIFIANNSIDGGTNLNIQFASTSGTTYYWRADMNDASDFVGEWSNPNHWTSNATDLVGAGGCLPTLADTVVFDNLSFSGTSNSCSINSPSYCKVLVTQDAILLEGGSELYISNSIFLDNSMTFDHDGKVYMVGTPAAGEGTILTNSTFMNSAAIYFDGTGHWDITSEWLIRGAVIQRAGDLYTNGNHLEIGGYSHTAGLFDFSNSTIDIPRIITIGHNAWYHNGGTLVTDGSYINFDLNYYYLCYFRMGTEQYNRVRFNCYATNGNNQDIRLYGDASFHHAQFDRQTYFYGSNTFDSLTFKGGEIYYFVPGEVQTLVAPHGKILVDNVGPGSFVNFESTVAGQKAYFHKEYGSAFCVDWMKIKDNEATKGAVPADPYWAGLHSYLQFETGENCDNINGSSTGIWNFSLPPILQVSSSHDPVYNLCAGDTTIQIPIELTGTYPYSIIYDWTDIWGNAGTDTILVNDDDNDVLTPFVYNLTLHPWTTSNYTIDIAAWRCGERNYHAPVSNLLVQLPEEELVSTSRHGQCLLTNNSVWAHFVDEVEGKPILSMLDSTNASDVDALGQVDVWADFDPTVQYWNSIPYLQRSWKISPANNVAGKVRLYFTQAELDELENYTVDSDLDPATDMILWKFVDTIKNGTPVQVPFTVIPLTGQTADPFTNTTSVWAIEFEVNSFSGFMLQPTTIAFLSTNLTDFKVKKQDENTAQITWLMENENDVLEYELERSANAVDFEKITRTKASDATNVTYEYLDEQPLEGTSYYRLKFVHKDASISYSNIQSITFGTTNYVELFPIPVQNQKLNLRFTSATEQEIEVTVLDILGRPIYQKNYATQAGLQTLNIPLSNLAAGNYLLRVTNRTTGLIHQEKFNVID